MSLSCWSCYISVDASFSVWLYGAFSLVVCWRSRYAFLCMYLSLSALVNMYVRIYLLSAMFCLVCVLLLVCMCLCQCVVLCIWGFHFVFVLSHVFCLYTSVSGILA